MAISAPQSSAARRLSEFWTESVGSQQNQCETAASHSSIGKRPQMRKLQHAEGIDLFLSCDDEGGIHITEVKPWPHEAGLRSMTEWGDVFLHGVAFLSLPLVSGEDACVSVEMEGWGAAVGREVAVASARARRVGEPAATGGLESRRKFEQLAEEWRSELAHTSSITEIAMHPAYQAIIGMGDQAVPLILAELERAPDHWFWALKAITGADPVSRESRGRLQEMAAAWLRWGRMQGYRC